MNITITFRQMDPSNAVKRHAHEKVAKLQRFLRQPMTAKITLTVDRRRPPVQHVAEARITSGPARMEARVSTDDMYGSIDQMIDKLERQIRETKGAAESKARRGGATLRGGHPKPIQPPPEPAAPAPKSRGGAKAKTKAKRPAAAAKPNR
jgi:putative sigma-54 modulation protein